MSAVDDAERIVREATVSTAREVLDGLRWKPGQLVTNHEGERVYLKQMPGYITDCCFEDDPCDEHRPTPNPRRRHHE